VQAGASHVPRLVVGISRSPASWWALTWAIGEAQRRGARLVLVHVFRPRGLSFLDVEDPFAAVPHDPNADRLEAGHALIYRAIGDAAGQLPSGVEAQHEVRPGRPAAELTLLAHGGDVLVLGSRHRGWLRRHAPGSVSRACARRADCLVVIVPEPSPAALSAALPADAVRGRRHHWLPHREPRVTS
jgi:nucleotide-binding universal stress UspA family protein